ncbi:hypothetical protein F4804DRAFT_42227 [Jackrogersella minutella]|nr:hypothetical protein F4804DRAFT_42227 [Jackrogersella minutella]
MKELWSCSTCVGFAVLAVLAPATVATHDNGYQIHRWEKDHNILHHPKRDASCQISGYSLCPASVNGGCCPEGYACAVSSCYATTAGPTSACGTAGYYNCPLTAAPGMCCSVGYICNREGCQAPAGMTLATCAESHFACTSSPYGCCPNGMSCGSAFCYSTAPQTFAVSDTITTTNADGNTITTVVTSTTTMIPGPDMSTASAAVVSVPILIASTVSKLPSIETDSSSSSSSSSSSEGSGGLSKSALGGIIGGVVALLIIIIAVATIILWRLKRTEKAARDAAESKHEASGGQIRSQKSSFGPPTISEVDGMDVDSIMRARNAHLRSRSDDSTLTGPSPSQTPNLYGSNASTTPPTWGFQVPPSDASDGRQSSMDSRNDNGTYTHRISADSRGGHTRQQSNASELDGSSHTVSELDASDANDPGRRRSSSITRTPIHPVRRSSDPSRGVRGDNTAMGVPLGSLAEVSELHGHYGPPDLAAGQTAASPSRRNSNTSSASGPSTQSHS